MVKCVTIFLITGQDGTLILWGVDPRNMEFELGHPHHLNDVLLRKVEAWDVFEMLGIANETVAETPTSKSKPSIEESKPSHELLKMKSTYLPDGRVFVCIMITGYKYHFMLSFRMFLGLLNSCDFLGCLNLLCSKSYLLTRRKCCLKKSKMLKSVSSQRKRWITRPSISPGSEPPSICFTPILAP